MKHCGRCDTDKPVEAFSWRNKAKGVRTPWCKDCTAAYNRDYNQQAEVKQRNAARALAAYNALDEESRRVWNRTGSRERRDQYLRRHYHLTIEQYEEMVVAQDGRCAICEELQQDTMRVDHDHACCASNKSCGKCVRKLLCIRCNALLHALEPSSWRTKAEQYLNDNRRQ